MNLLVLHYFVYGAIHHRLPYRVAMESHNKRALIWLVGFFLILNADMFIMFTVAT